LRVLPAVSETEAAGITAPEVSVRVPRSVPAVC
jgi:hypothetical protein